MDLVLIRKQYREDGIFSTCCDMDGNQVMVTLEHAYPSPDGFSPKIPEGSYTCVRGQHRLHGMEEDFTTFEITGVAGHEGLLFHWGNFNQDSEGCILVGEQDFESASGQQMITASRAEFAKFMALQEGLDSFTLVVKG